MNKEEYELLHQKDLEYIANFCLMDDDFMKKVYTDKSCVETTLRIIMNKPDLHIISSSVEYVIHNLYGRSVRLDAFADDSTGKLYDMEVQRSDRGAEPKRARYNSSLMDANSLKKGEDHNALPESYVIFITENDVLGKNRPIYHIKRVIDETHEDFCDGTHIIYVNGEIQDDTPLGRLMHDFSCKNADDMYYRELADRVRYFKEDAEGVNSMCKAMEEMRKNTEQSSRAMDIKNLMKNMKLSIEQAFAALGIAKEDEDLYRRLVMA